MTKTALNHFWIRIKNKDKRAFGIFYEAYYPKLYSKSSRFIGDVQVCQDVVQETFIAFWNKVDQIQAEKPFMEAYMWQILRFKIASHYRNKKDPKLYLEDYLDIIDQEVDTVTVEFNEDLSNRVNDAIKKLKGKAKESFIMSRRMGLTYKEIAKEMRISKKTVEYHISNALQTLRDELKDFL